MKLSHTAQGMIIIALLMTLELLAVSLWLGPHSTAGRWVDRGQDAEDTFEIRRIP